MKKTIKRTAVFLSAALLLCIHVMASQPEEEGKEITLYRINSAENALEAVAYMPAETTTSEMAEELVQLFDKKGEDANGNPILPDEVRIASWSVTEEGVLELHFTADYKEMAGTREILVRAGTVKTFMQVPDVTGVSFLIGEDPLMTQRGGEVGVMTGDSFVELFSSDRESYRYDTFTLYFTDKSGENLVPETRRVYYRSSIPKMRVALEQLAKGPIDKGHYPTIPDSTKLNTVILSDKVCYADFDRAFTDQALALGPQIPLYSVVNTLIANTEAEKVEISIAGNAEAKMGDDIELYNYYQWNEELLNEPQEEE